MAILFSNGPGHLLSFPDPALAGQSRLVGMTGFPIAKSVITRLLVSAQGNYQCLHALGGKIFIYVFGDKIGSMQVSGLAFAGTCDDSGGSHGIEEVMKWYDRYRIAGNDQELEIMVGTTSLRGFLVGLQADTMSPESRIFTYSASLLLPPRT